MKPLARYTLITVAAAVVAFTATHIAMRSSAKSRYLADSSFAAHSDHSNDSANHSSTSSSTSPSASASTSPSDHASDNATLDEIAWLKSEFRLTPAQTATIAQLHDDYGPVCMTHCRAIIKARAKLAAAPTAEQPAARTELTRLEAVCHDATLAHLKRVAAVMSPDQGARFLALVEPKLSGQNHVAPLGLK